jgi:transposase
LFYVFIVNKIKSSPQSPDFNPIEILWHELKNYIREKMPSSIEEAVRHAIDFNKNLTAERCQKYINTIKKVFHVHFHHIY